MARPRPPTRRARAENTSRSSTWPSRSCDNQHFAGHVSTGTPRCDTPERGLGGPEKSTAKSREITREQLVPSAKHYPFNELLSDCRNYVKTTGRRLSFEYILLAGVNDSIEEAQELAKKIKGFQCHVNLIPYNPVQEAIYRRPSPNSVKIFSDALDKMGIAVSIRYSRGLDADAACGQLRASRVL